MRILRLGVGEFLRRLYPAVRGGEHPDGLAPDEQPARGCRIPVDRTAGLPRGGIHHRLEGSRGARAHREARHPGGEADPGELEGGPEEGRNRPGIPRPGANRGAEDPEGGREGAFMLTLL